MTPDPAESARLALYCAEAESVGPLAMPSVTAQQPAGPVVPGPALPAWVAKDHTLTGWLTGQDAYFEGWLNLGARRVFYGFVMEGPEGVTTVIRGTQSAAEWAIDGDAIPERTAHPAEGLVETGFWNLRQTLRFRSVDGHDEPLEALMELGAELHIVTGHSLGAAEAIYVALAIAEAGEKVRGRFIASPHPGNDTFAAYFASLVPDHAVYAYAKDVVPHLPGGLGYCALPNLITLPANPLVPDNVGSNHHAGNYAFMIDAASIALVGGGYPR